MIFTIFLLSSYTCTLICIFDLTIENRILFYEFRGTNIEILILIILKLNF